MTTRQRRPLSSDTPSSSALEPTPYDKRDKPGKSYGDGEEDKGLGFLLPVFALGMLRYMSATTNIIHDCDEVFNYWEPLHFLIYKSGFQTWEYRSILPMSLVIGWSILVLIQETVKQGDESILFQLTSTSAWGIIARDFAEVEFALRSYLYILFHKLVGWPASGWFGWREEEKFRVFYAVRIFLGLLSVITEATLVVALSRKYGKRLGCYTLAMLCLASGCFFASTSFLPSSFSMYAISLSSALYLFDRPAMAVAVAAIGTILGWPFSILAFLPVTIYSLIKKFKQTFLSGLITSVVVTVLSLLADHHFYRKWTSSVLNLLFYNVVGGGESHLYGTEGPLYYFKNGFNNFNFSFVLALLFLGILPITRKKYAPDLLVVVSPVYIWIAFMSLQPHKEERFMYPIYPLVCIAASAVIDSFPDLFRDKYSSNDNSLLFTAAKFLRPFILGVILCCSHARTFSLIHGYSAPIEIYKHLEHYDNGRQDVVVCVGSEWHRYPSSFFIPDYVGQVRWINDGFRGLLPFPFNSTLGGTSAAPSYFNDKNKASEEQYLQDIERCDFLVELQLQRPYPVRGSDLSTWEVLAALPYLDRELSPPMYRSFFIPWIWEQKNVFGIYKLLKRIPKD